jgi:hypothetical protein
MMSGETTFTILIILHGTISVCAHWKAGSYWRAVWLGALALALIWFLVVVGELLWFYFRGTHWGAAPAGLVLGPLFGFLGGAVMGMLIGIPFLIVRRKALDEGQVNRN